MARSEGVEDGIIEKNFDVKAMVLVEVVVVVVMVMVVVMMMGKMMVMVMMIVNVIIVKIEKLESDTNKDLIDGGKKKIETLARVSLTYLCPTCSH